MIPVHVRPKDKQIKGARGRNSFPIANSEIDDYFRRYNYVPCGTYFYSTEYKYKFIFRTEKFYIFIFRVEIFNMFIAYTYARLFAGSGETIIKEVVIARWHLIS